MSVGGARNSRAPPSSICWSNPDSSSSDSRENPIARTGALRCADHDAELRKTLVELMDVNVDAVPALGAAIRIVAPNGPAQTLGIDAGAAANNI